MRPQKRDFGTIRCYRPSRVCFLADRTSAMLFAGGMVSAVTIVQPITFLGTGLLFLIYPGLLGFLYAHLWKAVLPWMIMILLAVGCTITGVELQEPGIGWIVNPMPRLLRFLSICVPAALFCFLAGMMLRRLVRRFGK